MAHLLVPVRLSTKFRSDGCRNGDEVDIDSDGSCPVREVIVPGPPTPAPTSAPEPNTPSPSPPSVTPAPTPRITLDKDLDGVTVSESSVTLSDQELVIGIVGLSLLVLMALAIWICYWRRWSDREMQYPLLAVHSDEKSIHDASGSRAKTGRASHHRSGGSSVSSDLKLLSDNGNDRDNFENDGGDGSATSQSRSALSPGGLPWGAEDPAAMEVSQSQPESTAVVVGVEGMNNQDRGEQQQPQHYEQLQHPRTPSIAPPMAMAAPAAMRISPVSSSSAAPAPRSIANADQNGEVIVTTAPSADQEVDQFQHREQL